MALAGENMYSLLEDAYELTLVGLFVPLCLGLLTRRGGSLAAAAAMAVGSLLWLLHYLAQWDCFFESLLPDWLLFPATIPITLAGLTAYLLASLRSTDPRLLSAVPGPAPEIAG
jgi:Na+/proline symporter